MSTIAPTRPEVVEAARPLLFERIREVVDTTVYRGDTQGWLLPAARYHARRGFGEELWIPSLADSVMGMRLAGCAVSKCRGAAQGRSIPGRDVSLMPCGTTPAFRAEAEITFGFLALGDELLDRVSARLERAPLSRRLRDDLVFIDDHAMQAHTGHYLRRAFDLQEPPTALEMEARALLLVERLHHLHGEIALAQAPAGRLAPWQLHRVCDYLDAHLGEDISLGALAVLVGLSAKHFARAFRMSTGTPPHQWLIALRIERARQLLAQADGQPIAGIALLCGFADQSHFTAAFRRATGTTPNRYRLAATNRPRH